MMENVPPLLLFFVSVKDIMILCLKLERGNASSPFLEVTLFGNHMMPIFVLYSGLIQGRLTTDTCRILLVTVLPDSGYEDK